MAAAITDKFTGAFNSANPNIARVTVTRTAGAASLSCDNLAGWPTATAVHFSTYKLNTSNAVVAGSQIDWKGIVSGNTIGTLTRKAGATDAGSAIGDVVEMNPTGSWEQDLMDGITAQHNQDGTHGAVTATSVASTGAVSGSSGTFTGDVSENGFTAKTYRAGFAFDFIESGCVLSGTGYGSTLAWNLTSGVVWIGGKRLTVATASGTVTASKDTYFDLLDPGSGTVATLVNTSGNIVTNNAASPALAASSVRLGIIVSGAGSIAAATSVNQGQETMLLPIVSSIPYAVTDSLGNLICPRDPNRRILGYKQVITSQTGITAEVDITGLAVPVIVPAGRRIKIVCTPTLDVSAADTDGWVSIKENTTYLNGRGSMAATGASGYRCVQVEHEDSPTAGLHTYKLSLQRFAGTGTVSFVANAAAANTPGPSFIRVELM